MVIFLMIIEEAILDKYEEIMIIIILKSTVATLLGR